MPAMGERSTCPSPPCKSPPARDRRRSRSPGKDSRGSPSVSPSARWESSAGRDGNPRPGRDRGPLGIEDLEAEPLVRRLVLQLQLPPGHVGDRHRGHDRLIAKVEVPRDSSCTSIWAWSGAPPRKAARAPRNRRERAERNIRPQSLAVFSGKCQRHSMPCRKCSFPLHPTA